MFCVSVNNVAFVHAHTLTNPYRKLITCFKMPSSPNADVIVRNVFDECKIVKVSA
jgi:hypothetical protein